MTSCLEKSKCLASLSLFRELYDSNKDIYGILSEFLKAVVIDKGLHQFSLTKITLILNGTYDFRIPEAVVKAALKRLKFIKKYHGFYNVLDKDNLLEEQEFTQKYSKIKTNNDIIIKELFSYIEEHKDQELNDDDKGYIVNSFCSYLLDETIPQDYSEYISSFIIQNKQNINFTKKLNTIKEGVLLYSGLKYNSSLNDMGSWNTNLSIFLDTEILFSLAGYNGELYSQLFNDFYSFFKEINTRNQKKKINKMIKLNFFLEIQNEIEGFFKKAESIVEGNERLNPSVTAMGIIVNGCKTASDVIEKKAKFYKLLKSNYIQLDIYTNYYSDENLKYNIEDQETIAKLQNDLESEDIPNQLKLLNYINILRKGNCNNNFENSGYFFLTANSTTLKMAFHDSIKLNSNVPLATTLDFLTNKFWFKLNKGFGKSNYPKTFDIITKAQIILSTQLNNSVAEKYEELKERYKSGQITEDEAKATIVELRKLTKKPEEIDEYDAKDILNTIKENSIEKFIKEQELLRINAKKQAEENELLRKKLKQEADEKEKREVELKELRSSFKDKEKSLKDKNISTISEAYKKLEPVYGKLKQSSQKKAKNHRTVLIVFLLIYYLILIILIFKLGWETMEPFTYLIGLLGAILAYTYTIVTSKYWNPLHFVINIEEKILIKKMKKINFDLDYFLKLEKEINNFQKEN